MSQILINFIRKLHDKVLFLLLFLALVSSFSLSAQNIFAPQTGKKVPADVENMYRKGLGYLAKNQLTDGSWNDSYGRQPGVVALALIAFLAHGDDPNYGPYSQNIKRGINYLLSSANPVNGYIGTSMYNHGFATLALAESYGVVHDKRIGPALEKSVKLLLSAQNNNPFKAWRYHPASRDADTTISGACLVALFAAANAGIDIPEQAIDNALKYYETCQSSDGGFGYTSPGGSNLARTAIGSLVYALAGRKKSQVYKKTLAYLLANSANRTNNSYYFYYLYYGAQAFFHAPNHKKFWNQWNSVNIKTLKRFQGPDGSWNGPFGTSFSTATALLSLALNYRFLPIYER